MQQINKEQNIARTSCSAHRQQQSHQTTPASVAVSNNCRELTLLTQLKAQRQQPRDEKETTARIGAFKVPQHSDNQTRRPL